MYRKGKKMNNPKNSTGTPQVNYPYSEKILSEIKDVYAVENDREVKIATKASAFITITVAIIALYIPIIPFEKLVLFFASKSVNSVSKGLSILFLVILFIGLCFLGIAFYNFIKAYSVKGYNTVDVDDLLRIASRTEPTNTADSAVYQGIAAHYHKILRGTNDTLGNIKINSDNSEKNQVGIICIVIGFAIISLATIALRIIVVIP